VIAHSTFRLSPETKDLLRSLAQFFDLSLTDTVTRLTREEAERRGFLPANTPPDPGSVYSRAEATGDRFEGKGTDRLEGIDK